MNSPSKELFVISLRDSRGRTRRLFFASPRETTREMSRAILSQTEQMANADIPLERLCRVAETIAEGYDARRVAH